MSLRKSRAWIVLATPLVLAGSVALAGIAQPMLAADSTDPSTGDAMKMSAPETVARSKEMSGKMTQTEARVTSLQKRAEQKKDMVMVNCVGDKLVQMRGYIAVGNAAATALEAAARSNDDGARAHNFDRQVIIYQKVLVLGTEAEGCIGEDVSYIGATRVDVEIDPNIPNNDPTIPPLPVPSADRPPEGECASS